METRGQKMNHSELAVQVVISDIRSEIDLDGKELLKFASWLPGTRVMCTTGTLWLTQQGDLHDHFLKAGQSFTLYQGGTVLVQGLPCGKASILPLAAQGPNPGKLSRAVPCRSQPDQMRGKPPSGRQIPTPQGSLG